MTVKRISRRKVFIGLALFPLLALTAVLVLALSIDLNALRDDVAAEIEAMTGRRLALAGDVQLTLALNPTLVVQDVTLANAHWGSRPSMLRIGRLEGQLALLPLLSGRFVVRRIEFIDTELLLETDPLGRGNWSLGNAKSASTALPAALPVIDKLSFNDLAVTWRDGASGKATRFAVDRLTLTGIGAENHVLLSAESTDGASSAMPVRSLSLRLEAMATGYRISDLNVLIGEGDLSGDLIFTQRNGHQRLQGRLSSRLMRLADLTGAKDATKVNSGRRLPAGRVFNNTPFRVAIPPYLHAELDYRAQQIVGPAFTIKDVSTRILAERSILSLTNIEAQLESGAITANVAIDTTGDRHHLQLELVGRGLRVGELLQAASGERWLDAHGDLDLRLQGSGHSMAQIMASLTGTTHLLVGKGYAQVRTADTLIGGLSKALGTLVDKGSERARLNCIASSFELKRGIATSRLLLADTEYSTVYGEGSIDLRSERLALVLTPKPKSVSLNVTVPVEVGGTLAAPSFRPEKFATARKGIGLLAVVGFISFPPAALLGLGDLGNAEQNPCLALAARQAPTKQRNRNLVERAADNVEGTLDSIGSAIRGLFD